jgi:hypothetical protein
MSGNDRKIKSEKHGSSRTAAKLYFIASGTVALVTSLALLLASPLGSVSIVTSQAILTNVVELDGVLFGFTATMLALFYYKEREHRHKLLTLLFFIVTAFLSYLASIFLSFSYLMQEARDFRIFVPVILACFGGLCSSMYLIVAIIESEEKGAKL